MNLLFALHHSLSCNSASHVDGIARELSRFGYDCLVAVPDKPEEASRFDPYPYRVATFEEVLADPRRFRNGKGPDFLHAWTPRERMRHFRDRLAEAASFQTIIHLEDNEDYIARTALSPAQYQQVLDEALPYPFPDHLSHPIRSQDFFRSASGATVLIDQLAKHVPFEMPTAEFWPAVDESIWYPRPRNDDLREKMGIGKEEIVLTYHGNMHSANHREIRSLYLAVAMLGREGIPARLVRVGRDSIEHTPEYRHWAKQFTISVGYIVNRKKLSNILAMADVFVQPGTSDPFNDYRFPSKLPEFFAMGRPVVLPKTNIGLVTKHQKDAYVLDHADGTSIFEAVRRICSDKALYQTLADGALQFSRSQFSWQKSAMKVHELYSRCLARPQSRRAA